MRILHYSLGFPPYRSGGMTKFCMDLMKQQIQEGHEVSLLWPGEITIVGKKTRIKQHKPVEGIGNYEVINPTPVPLDEGIKDFEAFTVSGDAEVYDGLIKSLKLDVIHVHTLMGLHKALLDVSNKAGIRVVFTAHDFFPICPKVTMFRNGKICDFVDGCDECGVCNNTALSIRKIQILQSPLYRRVKDSVFVKILRKQHRKAYLKADAVSNSISVGSVENYKELRSHYYTLLKMMDMIHYNSSTTKKVFEKTFYLPKNVVISITHADIADHRIRRTYTDEKLRIRYMGSEADYKGYYTLRKATDKLWRERKDFVLDVHFKVENKPDYMNCHNRFSYEDLENIFNNTDVLICPSLWYETFGFTVLEAISWGVPVIISENVGAKDVLADGAGIIIDDIDYEKVFSVLKNLNAETLSQMNMANTTKQHILAFKDMTQELMKRMY